MHAFFFLIAHTAQDFVDSLIPRIHARDTYAFAFLVHPRDARDMERRFPFLALAPEWLHRGIQHYFWPVTVSRITGLTDQTTRQEVKGFVISIPMTAPEMLAHRKRALKHIRRATKLARNKGAKIVGLGALTSSLSRGGLDLLDIPGIAITTGHAYTGHTVSQTLLSHLNAADNPHRNGAPLAVVGAAGSVGALSAELLAHDGARTLILLDIERKRDKVEELKTRLEAQHRTLTVTVTTDRADLQSAVGIITATNTPDALLRNEHIARGTIIVDDAQPTDVAPELFDRDDVLVLEAGAVHTPGVTTNFNMGLADRYDNFCCLAEVLILASRRHTHNFVINRATLSDVAHVAEGGENLGFTLARPQNEHGILSEEHIAHVLSLLQARTRV